MKLKVAVLFGGKSTEHEISIISAIQAIGYIDRDKYDIIPVYMKTGRFNFVEKTISFTSAQNCEMVLTNVKKVSIEGYVWVDEPPNKNSSTYNSTYDSSRESTLKGVTVRLMKKGTTPIEVATYTTKSDGKYLFDSLIKLSELENYYVEFNYKGSKEFYKKDGTEFKKVKTEDTSQYIPVAFKPTSANGSKAMMKKVATKDIDLSGIARTYYE